MRTAVDYRSASKKNYKVFCERHPEANVTLSEWLEVIYGFNEEFRNYILETGEKEKLPVGVGSFSITKKKRKDKVVAPNGQVFKNLPIDWTKTKERGKLIYNLNFHTEGYFFGWKWFKKESRLKCATMWRFKASRTSSRTLAHYIKADNKYQHLYREWKR